MSFPHFSFSITLSSYLQGFLRDEVKYQKRSSFVREVASDWKNNCFLVGRDREVHELGEMIRDCFYRNEAYVVSVCGTAGVGKSSIVQTVYNHFVANRSTGTAGCLKGSVGSVDPIHWIPWTSHSAYFWIWKRGNQVM